MPQIEHSDLVLRIDGLSVNSAGHWAGTALERGAAQANISQGQRGAQVAASFMSSHGGAGTTNLAALLLLACEAEGVDVNQVVEAAKARGTVL